MFGSGPKIRSRPSYLELESKCFSLPAKRIWICFCCFSECFHSCLADCGYVFSCMFNIFVLFGVFCWGHGIWVISDALDSQPPSAPGQSPVHWEADAAMQAPNRSIYLLILCIFVYLFIEWFIYLLIELLIYSCFIS